MVNKTVHRGEGHGRIGEDPIPFSKRLVGGDHDVAPLIPCGDEFEEHACFGLVFGDVGEIVEDEQVELVELCYGRFQLQFASCDL